MLLCIVLDWLLLAGVVDDFLTNFSRIACDFAKITCDSWPITYVLLFFEGFIQTNMSSSQHEKNECDAISDHLVRLINSLDLQNDLQYSLPEQKDGKDGEGCTVTYLLVHYIQWCAHHLHPMNYGNHFQTALGPLSVMVDGKLYLHGQLFQLVHTDAEVSSFCVYLMTFLYLLLTVVELVNGFVMLCFSDCWKNGFCV